MNLATLIIMSLAVWRVSHMFVKEAGPRMIFAKLRAFLARSQKRSGGVFDLISCVYCFSVYTGLVASLFTSHGVFTWLAYGLGYSGAATLIEMISTHLTNPLSVITRPTGNNQISVGVRSSSEQGNYMVGNPNPPNGYMTVETQPSLND